MKPEGEDRPKSEGTFNRLDLGRSGEESARDFLVAAGFRIIETGYRLFRGEIDIIANDGDTLVFIEVKTRTGTGFGRPEEAVTPAKQRQIRKIALGYVLEHGLEDVDCRFDVVAIDRTEGSNEAVLIHFKDAFR